MTPIPEVIYVAVPDKGGITQFIDLLEKYQNRPSERIGFKSQYPFWFKKTVKGENPWISWWNPLSWIQVGNYLAVTAPRMVIFKYWHPLYAPAFGTIARLARNSYRIAIMDNVFPHEKFPLSKSLAKYFCKPIDHFVVMSNTVLKDLRKVRNVKAY